ncbi:MAG: hypothetical protein NNA23_13150 [Nitrospira sp.]|nr:hypothetical protein [Nitrospira sp.]
MSRWRGQIAPSSRSRCPRGWGTAPTLLAVFFACISSGEPIFAEDETDFVEESNFFEDQTHGQLPNQPSDTSNVPAADVIPSITLTGHVWRTRPGLVFLKTPIGLLTLSSKTTLKDLFASQVVTLYVHDAHWLIEIRKRNDGSLVHRYLGGPFRQSKTDKHTLVLWTPEGEKTFHIGSHERWFADLREGMPVIVEVDQTDTIVGVHDVQFDLQIGQLPTGQSNTHLALAGTVDKLKSNFIFLRTPLGIVNVNSKIGIRQVRIGQIVTLRIHGRHVVADVMAPDSRSASRRFVTGPLEFATPDRTKVKLWTPEGEQIVSIDKTDHGKAVLAGLKEGQPITAELNDAGSLVEFHRLH